MSRLSRRDFLKLAGIGAGATVTANSALGAFPLAGSQAVLPNVLIIVFDAMSGRNLSLYGYHRKTTPSFQRFADRAVVYHAHSSAGNFTSPGTASLLTGMLPWTHRAINISGRIARELQDRNIFHCFGGDYHRFAYSQNLGAVHLFSQFQRDIDTVLPPQAFSRVDQIVGSRLGGGVAAYQAFDDFLFRDGTPPASLVFGLASRVQLRRRVARTQTDDYPRGLPQARTFPLFFSLADVFDGLHQTIASLPRPYVAYFHLWAPHAPYRASQAFDGQFADGWRPKRKPDHRMGDHVPFYRLADKRQNYDEYIADVDAEFGALVDALEREHLLDQTFVVVTSDHGEFLERGVDGHITPLLYEPVTNIPLLISTPGQRQRVDVLSPTSSIDVLPTLLHAAARDVPAWMNASYLPGIDGVSAGERTAFVVEAKENASFSSLEKSTVAMRRGDWKLIYYTGHEPDDFYELYNLADDPEELEDVFPGRPTILKSMQEELLDAFHAASGPLAQPI